MNTIESLYQLYEQSGVVFTDSRNVIQGGIFFALKGDRFDGNQYAQSAIEAGAVAAVVDDPKVVDGDPYFLVEDSLEALQSLARYHRSQFSFPVIGITGSNGKTTTKELVNKVLTTTYN
ncbi:MAG: Mur ligase domain-containing protein, partial [Bacteroidota bacterium]